MAQDNSLDDVIAVDESSLSDDSSSILDETSEISGRVDEELPASLSENWEDNPSEMTSAAGSMFPRDEYLVIMDVVHQLHGVFPIQHLVTCIKACIAIQPNKRSNQDSTFAKRFVREAMQMGFERCLRPDTVQRMTKQQLDFLLEAFMCAISLCAAQLKRFHSEMPNGFTSPEVQDAESDLVPILMCIGHLLDLQNHIFFSWNRESDLPKHALLLLNQKAVIAVEVDDHDANADPISSTFDPDQHPDLKWFRCCLKHFFRQGCFRLMKEILSEPQLYSVLCLDWLMHLLKLVTQHVPSNQLSDMPQLMGIVLDYLLKLINQDEERLSNFGRDRNYMHFSSVLQNASFVLGRSMGVNHADFKEVAAVQRKFIEAMLQSSNFNKLLSGVRECNHMLKRSKLAKDRDIGNLLQSNTEWLTSENIVKLMLRANLHQRQYAEQVLGILTLLTEEHFLKEEYLEMLWSLTEQEDTFETVKNNVYMILAEIASALEPQQLDLLFRKFQVNKGRSVSDTMRILDLLKRLAVSDSEAGSMADKLLAMMWELTMHTDAHPELLRSNVMQDVLRGYDDRGHTYLLAYVRRCLDQLRGRRNVCSSLNMLRMLLGLCPKHRTVKAPVHTLGDLVDHLIQEEHVLELLVSNLKAVMRQAHLLKKEHPKAEPLGEGFYNYQQILQEHLLTIEYLAKHSEEDASMSEELVVQLWNAFLREPVTELDLILGVSWFKNALDNQFLSPNTLEMLLQQHAVQTPVEQVDSDWFKLFEVLFVEVNVYNRKLDSYCPGSMLDEDDNMQHFLKEDLEKDPGLTYLWRVAMECGNEEVAQSAQLVLAKLYHADTPAVESTPRLHAALLKRCMDLVFGSCKALLGKGPEETVDWPTVFSIQIKDQRPGTLLHLRVVNRALSLLLTFVTAVQGRTMPPVPAHKASFAGTPCVLDCQFFANSHRFKVQTHSNEYIGWVRKKAAAEIQSQPQGVRLTCAGQEWNNDSLLVSSLEVKTRQVVNVSTSSINNTYTKTWNPEYVEAWHAYSPIWSLSKMEHIYDVLFLLADLPNSLQVRSAANDLLNQLPTSASMPALLKTALSSSSPLTQLKQLLLPKEQGTVSQPAKLLYTLQALHGVLFPINEGSSSEQQDVQMAAAELQGPGASSTVLIRDAFLSTGCLLLVCNTVQQACRQAGQDLSYLHSINRLMVLVMGSIAKEMAVHAPVHEAQSDTESAQQRQPKEEAMQGAEDASEKAPTPQPSPSSQVCALASALNLRETEQVTRAHLDQERAALMVSFLIDLARQAGCMWGVSVSHSSMLELSATIVRDALGVLLAVLEQQPDSCLMFLKDNNSVVMAADLLLNTASANMRISASDALHRICINSQNGEAHQWLLRLLISQRTRAASLGKLSCELFDLFHKTVSTISTAGAASEFALAEELLQDEVQQLHKVPKVEDEGSSLVLEWRLRLVHRLVLILEKYSVGSASEGGLVRLLLTEYLFPEAHLQSQYPNGVVPGDRLHGVLTACPCSSVSCRREALELVADLMVHSLVTLKEGAELLHTLHYSSSLEEDIKWDQQPPTLMRGPDGYVGLKNAGATCYMNATLQQLFMQPRIRGLVLSAAPVEDRDKDDNLFHNVQVVFTNLLLSCHGFYTPRGFWQAFKDYDGQAIDTREHQDVYEFFTRLQDQVDHHLRVNNQKPALQAVTGGKFVQQIICRDVDYRSERMEDFYQISVEVRGKKSLERSLESYVQGELMEGDNAYHCEEIGRKVTAVKRSCIKELPDTLVIHLKRFEFDHHMQNRFKVRDRFEFPLHLDMFKYTAEGLAAAEGNTTSSSTTRPSSYYKYELKGVIVHSGSAFTGHYYSYIKERNRKGPEGKVAEGRWFCFDDKLVKPWNVSDLEQDCYGGFISQDFVNPVKHPHKSSQDTVERAHSAYMLFYDRAEQGVLEEEDCLQDSVRDSAAASGSQQTPSAGLREAEQSALARPASHPSARLYKTPFHLPQNIYESVMQDNIRYLHRLHLLDKEYFRFVRLVVDWSAKDSVGMMMRKARRTNQNASNSQQSSMSEGGNGDGDSVTGLSRRGEETYLAASICTRLAFHFTLKVYLTSHAPLRGEVESWKDLLVSLIDRNVHVVRVLLECFLEEIGMLRCYLHSCALKAVRDMVVWLVVTVIQRAVTLSTPAPSTPASPSNLDAPTPPATSPTPHPQPASINPSSSTTASMDVAHDPKPGSSSAEPQTQAATASVSQGNARSPKVSDTRAVGSTSTAADAPAAQAGGSGVTPRTSVTVEGVSGGLAGSCAGLVHNLVEEVVKMLRHALTSSNTSSMTVEVHAIVEILWKYCKLGPSAVTTLGHMDVLPIAVQLVRKLQGMNGNGEDYWAEELIVLTRLMLHMLRQCSDLAEVWLRAGMLPPQGISNPYLIGDLRCEDVFPQASLAVLLDERRIMDMMPNAAHLYEEDSLHMACLLTWNNGMRSMDLIRDAMEFLDACTDQELEPVIEPLSKVFTLRDDLFVPRLRMVVFGIPAEGDNASLLSLLSHPQQVPVRLLLLLKLTVAIVDSSPLARRTVWDCKPRMAGPVKHAFSAMSSTLQRMEHAMSNPNHKNVDSLQHMYDSIFAAATTLHKLLLANDP